MKKRRKEKVNYYINEIKKEEVRKCGRVQKEEIRQRENLEPVNPSGKALYIF
jgi:hypothetical protein